MPDFLRYNRLFAILSWITACSNLPFISLKARIKKIMQTDEDVGKVAAAVPVIICILDVKLIRVV